MPSATQANRHAWPVQESKYTYTHTCDKRRYIYIYTYIQVSMSRPAARRVTWASQVCLLVTCLVAQPRWRSWLPTPENKRVKQEVGKRYGVHHMIYQNKRFHVSCVQRRELTLTGQTCICKYTGVCSLCKHPHMRGVYRWWGIGICVVWYGGVSVCVYIYIYIS